MVTVQKLVLHLVDICSLIQKIESRFVAGRKMIKVALSAALKPTAVRDLELRSMLCLRRTFPKKIKVARPFKSFGIILIFRFSTENAKERPKDFISKFLAGQE